MEPPEEKPVEEYTTHERRAEVLQLIKRAGSPFAVNQSRLAERYDVHRSTISRDMDRLREAVDEHIGQDAKLTTRTLFEKTVRELHDEGEWKAAWDVVMDWNEWLADIGEQYREPDHSKLDVDVDARTREVAYTVVRGDGTAPPAGDAPEDHEALGFTSAPASIDVETPGGESE